MFHSKCCSLNCFNSLFHNVISRSRFRVNPVTGEVFLGDTVLDYEEQRKYSLSYIATDGGGRSTLVSLTVEVLDFNDEGPVFSADQYQAFIGESSTDLNPNVTVQVYIYQCAVVVLQNTVTHALKTTCI